jgi:valyl-tRNA synthetase
VEKAADFGLVQEVVRSIRNLRAEKAVKPARRIPAIFVAGAKAGLLKQQAGVLAVLAGLDESQVKIVKSLVRKPEDSLVLVVGMVEIYVPLSGMVDLDEERARLNKELADVTVQIERLQKLLGSDFANKAPAAVVDKERERLAAFEETAGKLKAQLS